MRTRGFKAATEPLLEHSRFKIRLSHSGRGLRREAGSGFQDVNELGESIKARR